MEINDFKIDGIRTLEDHAKISGEFWVKHGAVYDRENDTWVTIDNDKTEWLIKAVLIQFAEEFIALAEADEEDDDVNIYIGEYEVKAGGKILLSENKTFYSPILLNHIGESFQVRETNDFYFLYVNDELIRLQKISEKSELIDTNHFSGCRTEERQKLSDPRSFVAEVREAQACICPRS